MAIAHFSRNADRGVRNYWQHQTENTSGRTRVQFQAPAMHFRTPLRYCQSKAGAAGFARTSFINAVKAIENSLPVLRRNAGTRIFYLDAGMQRIALQYANRDVSIA